MNSLLLSVAMLSIRRLGSAAIGVLCALALAWQPAGAQEEGATDPPARVGAVSALRGPVDLSSESGAPWAAAKLNQPVTTQTSLWAPPGSQAEVRIGSTSVRLDGNTQAIFSQLDDHGVALDVAQGIVRVRLRSLPTGDTFSLAADGVRAEALAPGDYRVGYDPDRRAYTVRALAGRLRVVTPSNSLELQTGQEVLVEGGGADLQLRSMAARDEFDRWAEARDGEQDRLASLRYVSPEVTGVEALDAYGGWDQNAEYGAIWYPRTVVSGWAPYRYGHWAWVAPWGWTWVDDAPWGFAPFHYGRWALVSSRWGWVPGPIVARPVWAPALVGYVGGRPSGVNVSIGIGIGAPLGWFPLGPYETYHPTYRYSPRYVSQINIINYGRWHDRRDRRDRDRGDWRDRRDRDRDDRDFDPDRRMTTQPVARYRYAQRADAVTVAREDAFRGSRPIGRDRLALTPAQTAQLQPVSTSLLPRDTDDRRDRAGSRGPDGVNPARRDGDGNGTRPSAGGRVTVAPVAPVATLPAPPPRTALVRDIDRDRPRPPKPGDGNRSPDAPDVRRPAATPGLVGRDNGRPIARESGDAPSSDPRRDLGVSGTNRPEATTGPRSNMVERDNERPTAAPGPNRNPPGSGVGGSGREDVRIAPVPPVVAPVRPAPVQAVRPEADIDGGRGRTPEPARAGDRPAVDRPAIAPRSAPAPRPQTPPSATPRQPAFAPAPPPTAVQRQAPPRQVQQQAAPPPREVLQRAAPPPREVQQRAAPPREMQPRTQPEPRREVQRQPGGDRGDGGGGRGQRAER